MVVISHRNIRKLLRKKTNYFNENDSKNSGLKKMQKVVNAIVFITNLYNSYFFKI